MKQVVPKRNLEDSGRKGGSSKRLKRRAKEKGETKGHRTSGRDRNQEARTDKEDNKKAEDGESGLAWKTKCMNEVNEQRQPGGKRRSAPMVQDANKIKTKWKLGGGPEGICSGGEWEVRGGSFPRVLFAPFAPNAPPRVRGPSKAGHHPFSLTTGWTRLAFKVETFYALG